jgi:hypothetical protein
MLIKMLNLKKEIKGSWGDTLNKQNSDWPFCVKFKPMICPKIILQ